MDIPSLVLKGDNKAVARAITLVENRDEQAQQLVKRLYPHTGHAFVIGVTGPTGTGKSTLVDKMIIEYRKRGKKVGVLAVDPSSPFTGGALLGDRIRMLRHNLDSGVFIRSMASRGDVGGLARATRDAVRIFDASGKDIIIIETVGIGQTESEIIRVADATVVILMPQLGDEIQAVKAGIMEIGDIFVVNKFDLEGANRTFYNTAALIGPRNGWKPPVIRTVAKTGKGIPELLDALRKFREYQEGQPNRQRVQKEKIAAELLGRVKQELTETVLRKLNQSPEFQQLVDRTLAKKTDPNTAARTLLRRLIRFTGE